MSLSACAPTEAELEGTVQAQARERVQATIAAIPTATATPTPTATPEPTPTPTLTPTATATPTPTTTPTPTATPAATATPTPRPTPTPAPPYSPRSDLSDPWQESQDGLLELKRPGQNPAAAAAIESLGWVADGIRESIVEQAAVVDLLSLARYGSGDLLQALTRTPWFQDDLMFNELLVVRGLISVAYDNESAAVRLLGMPFLEQPEYLDFVALSPFYELQQDNVLDTALAHPALRDGITDAQRGIVGALKPWVVRDSALMTRLFDTERTAVAEKVVSSPLSGDVALSVIWPGDGASAGKASHTLALVEDIVSTFEEFLDAPYPHEHVTVVVANSEWRLYRSSRSYSHIVMDPDYYDRTGFLADLIADEFWGGSWVGDGARSFMASMYPALRHDAAVPAPRQCAYAANVHEMVNDPESPSWRYLCDPILGEGMFIDLYLALGEAAFRKAFTQLQVWWSDDALRVRCMRADDEDLCYVDTAFLDGLTPGLTEEDIRLARPVINQHYYGSETPPAPTPSG